MYKWFILLICLHAKYGHLMRADWNNEDASYDTFIPMMMGEGDTHHHSSYQKSGYRDKRPISSYDNHPYRYGQRYQPDSNDKCDKYSPNYSPQHPDCQNNRCDKTSMNYMPNHPDCADKCDPASITYQPNLPECGKCDPNSINFMPNDPSCPVIPTECPVPDPCNEACPNFDKCNQECPSFDKCDQSCPSFDECDQSCPTFDECNESCSSFDECNEDCPSFDQCNESCPSFDECNENCPSFDKCNESCPSFNECDKDCEANNPTVCTSGCPDFEVCDAECEGILDQSQCERCDDECDPECEDVFNPDLEKCQAKPKCQVMLSSIDTTACQISEEFQAMTCGECPDADNDIEELTDACRNPSPDLIDCMATIGSMEQENGPTCKMYEFKFNRSTMSPKCIKPKPKYPSYAKPEPRVRQRYFQRQPNKLSYPAHYQAPRKLFYKPKKMVVVVRKRYI